MKSVMVTLSLLLTLVLVSCQKTPSTSQEGAKPAPEQAQSAPAMVPAPAPPEAELPEGTIFRVRLDQALSTARDKQGDTFTASLDEPVSADGKEILPKGTRFKGRVTTARSSGRLEGRAVLGITLESFELNRETYLIKTSLDTKTSEAHKKRNVEIIGGGAGLGAMIGAIAGGGKGAAIGAAAGAAAGTGGAAATGKKDVQAPAETVFRFTLKAPVRVQG